MRKVFIVIFLALVANLFSNTDMIIFDNLPQKREYMEQVVYLYNHVHMVENFYGEWNFDVPKPKMIRKVKSLISDTRKMIAIEKNNCDLELYLYLLMHYLYNLCVEDYKDEIIDGLNKLKKKYPQDYRPYWLLGLHYAKSAQLFKAHKEFEKIIKKIPEKNLHPSFVEDLASIEELSLMFSSAIKNCKLAAKLRGPKYSLKRNPFYQRMIKRIKIPKFGKALKKEDVFIVLRREGGIGFLSRLFGMWIPSKEEWGIKYGGVNKNKTFLLCKVRSKKKNITYNIVIIAKANSKIPFSEYVKKGVSVFKKAKKIKSLSKKYNFVTYETKNNDMYKEVGGAHGYAIFFESKEPKIKGLKIEKPAAIESAPGEEVSYYVIPEYYTRYDGTIYYEILLDTCNNVFNESKKDLLYFLDNLIIE